MNDTVEKVPGKVGTSIGYAVTFIMDYGNGRQLQIAGTLPLNATKAEFDAELDKLRMATNRQQAFIMLRDNESKLNAEFKMIAALEHMQVQYEKEAEAEMKRLADGPNANHNATKSQITNMRSQVSNYKQLKTEELERHRANASICEVTIASIKKEIEG